MKKQDISALRREYIALSFGKKQAHSNPIMQFSEWFDNAIKAELPDANAMTLATVSPQGQPSARVVLLKDFDSEGFVFYTNYQSHKASELSKNPKAALVFFWAELARQVRIEGTVTKVTPEESDQYFASRPREAQIGAIASQQSEIIPNRKYLDELFKCLDEKFSGNQPSRPPHWGGYRLKPHRMEFWQGRFSRLNDRLLYELNNESWNLSRLAP